MKFVARLTAIGLAVALAAEGAARLLIPMDALVYRDSADAKLAVELLPGSRGMKNGVQVEISEQGLRDEAVPAAKAPGERRVVVVGGHETFGIGVEEKETFVRELAEGLIDPGEGRARTINLSMYSYHLGQKVELACRRLASLSPDLVVLQASESGDAGDPYPALLQRPRLKNWVREHSVLARWASQKYYLRPRSDSPGKNRDFDTARAELRRFKECADAAGARAVVLMVPDITARPTSAPSELRRGIASATKELGVPLVDGASALGALRPEDRAVFSKQHFLSPAAHRALADQLRRRLKPLLKKKTVPASARRPSV